MKSFRVVMAVVLTAVAGAALARAGYNKAVNDAYKLAPGSAFDKAACLSCHTPAMKNNPYGSDLKKAMTAAKSKTLTAAIDRARQYLQITKACARAAAAATAAHRTGNRDGHGHNRDRRKRIRVTCCTFHRLPSSGLEGHRCHRYARVSWRFPPHISRDADRPNA